MEKIHSIKEEYCNIRIDKWIKKKICHVPQGLIEKNLRNGNILVNNYKVKSSYKVQANDKIILINFNPQPKFTHTKKKYIPQKKDIKESSSFIIENNDNFAVINKPYGLPVQGGTKTNKNLIDLISENKEFFIKKPYIVHRIDKDTSGILIVAKNRKYAQLFTTLFRIRKIHKTYICVCYGAVDSKKGTLINNLERYDKNKKIFEKAITNYKILDKNKNASLLLLNPITGRKHQIRKQLALFGHPIFGDSRYYLLPKKNDKINFLMLHSYSIKFIINEKKFMYSVDTPEYFKKILKIKNLSINKNF